jgi:DNA-directed RNA polymerase subunit RPC12/RpoP
VPKVDREEVLRALRYDRQQYDKGFFDGKAAAVVRGRGIDDRTNIICSNCGAKYSDEIIFMNRNFKYEDLNYCPYCGARMDKEVDDE